MSGGRNNFPRSWKWYIEIKNTFPSIDWEMLPGAVAHPHTPALACLLFQSVTSSCFFLHTPPHLFPTFCSPLPSLGLSCLTDHMPLPSSSVSLILVPGSHQLTSRLPAKAEWGFMPLVCSFAFQSSSGV